LEEEHAIPRSLLFIQTKFTSLDGQDTTKPLPYDPDAPIAEQVRQSVATSLRELGTTWIDSMIMHSPLGTVEETLEAWRAFEVAVDEGKVRSNALLLLLFNPC
jgi:diketogulonate reductase-like aldo/keto reductase